MHLEPPKLNVESLFCSHRQNSSQTLLVTIIRHLRVATKLSTVGGDAFYDLFLVHCGLRNFRGLCNLQNGMSDLFGTLNHASFTHKIAMSTLFNLTHKITPHNLCRCCQFHQFPEVTPLYNQFMSCCSMIVGMSVFLTE